MPEVFVVRPRREAPSVGDRLVPAARESATSAAGPSSARQGGTQVRGRPAATLRSERRPRTSAVAQTVRAPRPRPAFESADDAQVEVEDFQS